VKRFGAGRDRGAAERGGNLGGRRPHNPSRTFDSSVPLSLGITRSIRTQTRRTCWPASSSTRAAAHSCAFAEPLVWRRRRSSSRASTEDRSTSSHCSNSHRGRCATHWNRMRSDARIQLSHHIPLGPEGLMTDAESYWCLVVFRCVHCGRNEAFAEEPSAVEPRDEEIRNKTYQAICRYCGGQSQALGISAIEMHSGVERRTKTRKKD